MAPLQTIVQNTCCTQKGVDGTPTFKLITMPTGKQKRAFELIGQIKP